MYPYPLYKHASIPGAMINAVGTGADIAGEVGSSLVDAGGDVADAYGNLPLWAQIGAPASIGLLAGTHHIARRARLDKARAYEKVKQIARERAQLQKQVNVMGNSFPPKPMKGMGSMKMLGLLGAGGAAALGGKYLYDKLNKSNDDVTLPGGISRNRLMTALGGASLGATAGYGAGRYYDPDKANMYALGGGVAGGLGGYAAHPSLQTLFEQMGKPAAASENFIVTSLSKDANFNVKEVRSNFITAKEIQKQALFDDPVGSLLGLSSGSFLGYGLGNVVAKQMEDTPENSTMKRLLPSLTTILGGAGGALGMDALVKRIDDKRKENEQAEIAQSQRPVPSYTGGIDPRLLQLLAQR